MAIGQLLWGRLPIASGAAGRFCSASRFSCLQPLGGDDAKLLTVPRRPVLQGIGGSVGRIIVTAIVRDLFVGRQMARVMSMIMMVFILVPMLAPSVGQLIILVGTWRWLFAVLLAASLTAFIWASYRLPETRPTLAAGALAGPSPRPSRSSSRTVSHSATASPPALCWACLSPTSRARSRSLALPMGLASCSHLPLPVSLAQSRWPRSPTHAWSGALACGDCHIRRWSRISASAPHWRCSAP